MNVNPYPLRDVQDACPAAYDDDGNEIYHGETTFHWEGREVCRETFVEAVSRLLREDPRQVALEMGVEVTRYE